MHFRCAFISAFLSAVFLASPTHADTSARAMGRALAQLPDGGARFLKQGSGSSRPAVLVPVADRESARAQGLIPITATLAVGACGPSEWDALQSAPGVHNVLIAPYRYPLLDQVGQAINLEDAHNSTGLQGEGTIVGIVDTGIDAAHPAFLTSAGKSRVAWMLAFGEKPRGLHPVLEEEYGCNGDEPCAVLAAEDLDAIIDSRILAHLPKDPIGHGTHIASLAAGADDSYTGVAPFADLIVVAAAESDGAVSDARILLGTKFVFDRAAERGQPAVVNVSLGSSFGAHDGSSAVEQGLADLASGPGQAVVIAAGNSGALYEGEYPDYAKPFGIHTEVAVLPSAEVRVPVITPPRETGGDLTGSFFVWISTRPGDHLSVGFHNGEKSQTNLITPGTSGGLTSEALGDSDDYDIVILNGVNEELEAEIYPGSIVVAIVGTWENGRVFDLILQGSANARMWITGTGDLSSLLGPGPLFPRARAAGTVAVPGSHRDLVTVGATINRTRWTSYAGSIIEYAKTKGVRTHFSAAGPNQNGAMKPDLVAPGGGVIGAMAREADPRTSLTGQSQFSSNGACSDFTECFVIDDTHGLASGTSMSSPIVAGAIALLMQRDPTITMAQAKAFLMAGSRRVPTEALGSLVGTGELNIEKSLIAQERNLDNDDGEGSGQSSRVVWAEDFLYPGGGPSLEGYLLVRDEEGLPINVTAEDFTIEVEGNGRVTSEISGTGLVHLSLSADAGTASEDLIVTASVRNHKVSRDTFPIERDPIIAEHGFEVTGGTCAASPIEKSNQSFWMAVLLGALIVAAARRPGRGRHQL